MSLDMADCPRCHAPLHKGFVDPGKGPFRWNEGDHDPDKTIKGGELLIDRPLVWGRMRAAAVRCLGCSLVMFEFDPHAENKAFTPTK